MKPRQQRMLAVGLAVIGVAIAAGLTLRAFDENMMFFVEISDVVAGEYPSERNFRIGGLVVDVSTSPLSPSEQAASAAAMVPARNPRRVTRDPALPSIATPPERRR